MFLYALEEQLYCRAMWYWQRKAAWFLFLHNILEDLVLNSEFVAVKRCIRPPAFA